MLLLVKERLDSNYCQVQDWKVFLFISYMHQTSFRGAQNILYKKRLASDMLIWKWKGSFQVHNLVHDFWKNYITGVRFFTVVLACTQKNYLPKFPIFSALIKLPSCELVIFFDMNICLQKTGISKHSWKYKLLIIYYKKGWLWNWTWYW